MASTWQNNIEKFNALSERERISVILLVVIMLAVVFHELLIAPMQQKYDIAGKQIAALQVQTQQLQKQYAVLLQKKQRDPDFQERQKIKLLDEKIAKLNVQLKEKMHGLIEPKQMAKVLEKVLTRNTDLKIQRVQSLGAEPLEGLASNNKDEEEAEPLGIYKHGLQIEFKGSYLSTLKYLKALHELPWKFYWDGLDFQVEKYPQARVVITVHTLSFHKGWIGV